MSTHSSTQKKSTSTGRNKKIGAVSGARKTSEGVAVDHFPQARIKELEHQVSDLKRRLDELRKAKNTTIIKKDKEYISTGTPHIVCNSTTATGKPDLPEDQKERTSSLDTEQLQDKVQESNQEVKTLQENIAALKELHKAELEELKKEVEKQAKQSDSSLAAELEIVKRQNQELQDENKLLRSKGIDLQLQVDDLLEALSKKEAEWCSKEEKLMLEIKTSWGEKYQKWMAQTEQKMEELQTANDLLKRMLLEKEKPG
ncbi:hypothetical protein OS493_031451 [Desmophyllum pertusum]|uniref:Uncharacterized protein n=1 Tax=Desmophyllum pertusum TaxID=174260 RepID=A0A9W9ZXU3_9CNID|nr:hypothetical protein OS493_031451 [Desmophyllum pertusum]